MTREEIITYMDLMAQNSLSDGMLYVACKKDLEVIREAATLLKTQEPRVMTLEEVLFKTEKIGFPCWIEDKITEEGFTLLPAVIISDETYVQYYSEPYYEGAIYHYDYNKRLRCWTSRPTEEQRKAVAWND